jgi:hypothetical protein
MSFDLTGLAAYTDEHAIDLIKRSTLRGRTLDLIQIQPGIKSSAEINILDSDLVLQAGACGFGASGSTTLTQRTIAVDKVKINEAYCLDDLESFYVQKLMRPGSYNEDNPIEQIWAEEKAEKIQAVVEDIIWKGDKVGGSGNLALSNGFLQIFGASGSGVIDGNPAGLTAINDSNIVDIMDNQVSLINVNDIDADDLHIFCGYEIYRMYAKALRDANLFHYDGTENQGADFSQLVPGTNVRVIAVRGLNGTNKIVTGRAANFYFGTDLMNDQESWRAQFDTIEDDLKLTVKFKLGVQVAFPERVVYFSL